MKKQIDGWAFRGDDGEWKMFHSDFGKVQYQMLEGKLGAGKIVEVRIIDASDDSKDVVVPREGLRRLMDWCEMMCKAHRRSLETLNCDDTYDEIIAEILPEPEE